MSDYQICAVIDGDDIDLRANREKFRILEQAMRDKMKELGLDKPRCGVVSCCTEVPKPLRHYCPECKQEVCVNLLVSPAAELYIGLTNGFGNVVENRDNVYWVADDDRSVSCVCSICHHEFCKGEPETIEQFKQMCGEENHHE